MLQFALNAHAFATNSRPAFNRNVLDELLIKYRHFKNKFVILQMYVLLITVL